MRLYRKSNSSRCRRKFRSSYQYFTQAKMSRLREIGYNTPFTTLEEAVDDYVIRYLSQSDPYM